MSVARQPAASRPAAVLLAAGFASRMRGIVKLLLEIDGEPLVRRTLRVLHEAGVGDVVVVLGHHAAP
ncbi:MAG: NTP transferase domain-containing protein, partial [Quisquiliibacterium sp.]